MEFVRLLRQLLFLIQLHVQDVSVVPYLFCVCVYVFMRYLYTFAGSIIGLFAAEPARE
jgi:hypothetical protein